jgi:predicted nucleic acid-binding protein
MMLLDTMVIVYARTPKSPFHAWAKSAIAAAAVAAAVIAFGVAVVDVPVAAAETCGAAYRNYRRQRKRDSGMDAPKMPLPDFFIGAHAETAGWTVVTNDQGRYARYFPAVKLVTP